MKYDLFLFYSPSCLFLFVSVLVLLSAHVQIFSVSGMQDLFYINLVYLIIITFFNRTYLNDELAKTVKTEYLKPDLGIFAHQNCLRKKFTLFLL